MGYLFTQSVDRCGSWFVAQEDSYSIEASYTLRMRYGFIFASTASRFEQALN